MKRVIWIGFLCVASCKRPAESVAPPSTRAQTAPAENALTAGTQTAAVSTDATKPAPHFSEVRTVTVPPQDTLLMLATGMPVGRTPRKAGERAPSFDAWVYTSEPDMVLSFPTDDSDGGVTEELDAAAWDSMTVDEAVERIGRMKAARKRGSGQCGPGQTHVILFHTIFNANGMARLTREDGGALASLRLETKIIVEK